jgi:hypothetical protein
MERTLSPFPADTAIIYNSIGSKISFLNAYFRFSRFLEINLPRSFTWLKGKPS